jgi:hypothetical protein
MGKLYLYSFLFITSIVAWIFYFTHWKHAEYNEEAFTIISTAFFTSIAGGHSFVSSNKDSIFLAVKCLFKRKERVYVSLSYLFKIKLKGENKYLMVKGNKVRHQYQPVGGVYKKFSSIAENWRKWEAEEARNTIENSDDLRFFTKRKYIPAIRKWFYEGKSREVDVWREFHEELIGSGILPNSEFQHIKPEFVNSTEEVLITRKGFTEKQFLIYNIYNVILSDGQQIKLNELLESNSLTEHYAFVDECDLDKELFIINNKEYQLGYHARYLKNNK